MINHLKRFQFLIIAVGVMLIVITAAASLFFDEDYKTARTNTYQVAKRSLDFKVRERGFVRPAKVVHIKSQIESNRAQLIWLKPEGDEVKQGEIVARFDANPLLEKLEKHEQEYADSVAQLESAKKLFDLEKEDQKGKLDNAKRAVDMAIIKADDIRNGSGVLDRSRVKQSMVKAQRNVELVERELEDFELLFTKGHVSKRERDKIAENLRLSEEALKLATAEWENFNKYQWPRMLNEATMLLDGARAEYERIKKTSEIAMQQKKDKITLGTRYLQKIEKRLGSLEKSIENCEVKAPIDGKLLYIKLHRADGRRKSRVGDIVWNAQSFMEIPDTTKMVVDVEIREVDVAKIQKGNKADITLDAIPDKSFAGVAQGIETIAKENGENEHLRKFNLSIGLDNASEKMHVGMSADVQILYQHLDDVLAVPAAAIFYHDGEPAVNIQVEDAASIRKVQVGDSNDQWVHVIDGLEEGETVVYN